MDECSDERMAPALHATDPANGNAKINHNYQLSPTSLASVLSSTDQVYEHSKFNSTVYMQMNGGQTICSSHSTDVPETTDLSVDAGNQIKIIEEKVLQESRSLCPGSGESGHYLSPVSSVAIDLKRSRSLALTCSETLKREHEESLSKIHRANGWSPTHESDGSSDTVGLKTEESKCVQPLNGKHDTCESLTQEDPSSLVMLCQTTDESKSCNNPPATETESNIQDAGDLSLPNGKEDYEEKMPLSSEDIHTENVSVLHNNFSDVKTSLCEVRECTKTDAGEQESGGSISLTATQTTVTCKEPESSVRSCTLNSSACELTSLSSLPVAGDASISMLHKSSNRPGMNSSSFKTQKIANSDSGNRQSLVGTSFAASSSKRTIELDCWSVLNQICDSVASSMESTGAVAQTMVTFKTTSPISAHCVQQTNVANKVSQNSPAKTECDVSSKLDLPNMMGLAHGLITGNHMENLPLKLTNTLHELAASLASGQGLSTDNQPNKVKASEGNVRRRTLSSAKSLNFEEENPTLVSRISNAEEIKSQHKLQLNDVSSKHCALQHQIGNLQARLNKIRALGLTRTIRKQLQSVATCSKDVGETQKDLAKSLSVDPSSSAFWKKLLEKKSKKHHRSIDSFGDDKKTDAINVHDVAEPLKGLHQLAMTRTGILKKELKYMQHACDPDMTDSSSDEESAEFVYTSGEGYVPDRKKANQTLPNRTDAASWTWAKERLSVAKRWTWLQAQVSDLEFKIRQHNDLYRQLRAAKGEVVIGHQSVKASKTSTEHSVTPAILQAPSPITALPVAAAARSVDCTSPCSVTQMMYNINKQTTNLLDNWSPLSVGTPSPIAAVASRDETGDTVEKDSISDAIDRTCIAARTRPLLYPVRRRKLIRLADITGSQLKTSKPPTVSHDSCIMQDDFIGQTPFQRPDGRPVGRVQSSIQLRAAVHDHSYHRILSHPQDVPLSLRVSSYMQGCHKWNSEKVSKRNRRHEKTNKRKRKNLSKGRNEYFSEKIKTRSKSATVVLERIKPTGAVNRVNSADAAMLEQQRRRGSVAAISDGTKRHRVNSVDSDSEANRSGTSTPTLDTNQHMQAILKRKRQADQAYDINNIVIPHGLTTTRIEKLQYKEILTPGWRTANETPDAGKDADKFEITSDSEFQVRHDRYEILEKKKYMAYMEWGLNKKNGTRSMGRANMPSNLDAASSPTFLYPQSLRSSPITSLASSDPTSPASPEPVYSSALGIRTRRGSSDIFHSHQQSTPNIPDATSTPSHSISLNNTFSSSRLSTDSQPEAVSWELRSFPLSDAALEELQKKPVVPATVTRLRANDSDLESRFRPISRQSSLDTNTAPKHKPVKSAADTHSQPSRKRQRTNSQLSAISRDDDRHSDGSVSSSYSSRLLSRTRKETGTLRSRHGAANKPHKPSLKDDYYFYSELDSDGTESGGDSDLSDQDPLISEGENTVQWESRPVALPDKKAPMVFLYKKK